MIVKIINIKNNFFFRERCRADLHGAVAPVSRTVRSDGLSALGMIDPDDMVVRRLRPCQLPPLVYGNPCRSRVYAHTPRAPRLAPYPIGYHGPGL
jgi:hypothetical protein